MTNSEINRYIHEKILGKCGHVLEWASPTADYQVCVCGAESPLGRTIGAFDEGGRDEMRILFLDDDKENELPDDQ